MCDAVSSHSLASLCSSLLFLCDDWDRAAKVERCLSRLCQAHQQWWVLTLIFKTAVLEGNVDTVSLTHRDTFLRHDLLLQVIGFHYSDCYSLVCEDKPLSDLLDWLMSCFINQLFKAAAYQKGNSSGTFGMVHGINLACLIIERSLQLKAVKRVRWDHRESWRFILCMCALWLFIL